MKENAVVENRTLEYKSELPGGSDEDKRKFLADISAMANTSGGVVVYGVETSRDAEGRDTGVPIGVPGFAALNFDASRQRLESVLRDSLSPPVTYQATFVPVKLESGAIAVVVGVGRSALGPHMVTYGGASRFYRRSESGNYQPEIPELRRMFLEQTEWIEEALAFRDHRIDAVVDGRAYPNLDSDSPVIVHIIPLGRRGDVVDFRGKQDDLMRAFAPLKRMGGYSPRYNADGFLTFGQLPSGGRWCGYTQIFRNGAIESFATGYVAEPDGAGSVRRLWANDLREELQGYIPPTLCSVRAVLGVEPPYALCVSLTGIKGAIIPHPRGYPVGAPIDRDRLCLEPLVVEDPDSFSPDELLPVFDVVWQSAGWVEAPRG